MTTPVDPRLPDGGGWPLCGIYQLRPEGFGIATQNVQTFTQDHLDRVSSSEKRTTYNHGYDLTVNARTPRVDRARGHQRRPVGHRHLLSVGAGEPAEPSAQSDHRRSVLLHRDPIPAGREAHRGVSLPWYGLQLSSTYQRTPGPSRSATWTITQATANANGWAISTAPGSTPAAIAAATTSFSLFQTGQQFEEPLNQLDLRVAKRFSLPGGQRLLVNVDLYNAFNSAWVYTQNGTLGTNYAVSSSWLRPAQVLQARMFKLGGQFDF